MTHKKALITPAKPLEHSPPEVGGEEDLSGTMTRLDALIEAYAPGNYALADGVYHVYSDVVGSTATLHQDLCAIRAALGRRWRLEAADSAAFVQAILDAPHPGATLQKAAAAPSPPVEGWRVARDELQRLDRFVREHSKEQYSSAEHIGTLAAVRVGIGEALKALPAPPQTQEGEQ